MREPWLRGGNGRRRSGGPASAAFVLLVAASSAGCRETVCDCPDGAADAPAEDVAGEVLPEAVDGDADEDGGVEADGAAPPEMRVRPGEGVFEVGETWEMVAEARSGPAAPWTDVTAEAAWGSEDEAVAAVAAGGRLTAAAIGETEVTAGWGGASSPPARVRVVRVGGLEARGVWVTRWNYASAADVRTVFAEASAAGFNQVYFQVRGRADAFYRSSYEPWASELSGTLGVDPGWDPLQTAIDEGRARGLEVHAWLNTFPCWSGRTPPQVYAAHPEWIVVNDTGTRQALNDSYVFCSPGIPEVREHIANVVRDIDERYDVAGIHMDYIRYSGPEYSHDAASDAGYAAAAAERPGLSRADWQREQVTALVTRLHEVLGEVGEGTVLSAAVWGIYRNTFGWSAVSQGFADYYQDPRAWTAAGVVDALCPMIYWPLTDPPGLRTDFRTLIEDHVTGNPDRWVYAGVHGDYDPFAEIADEIAVARTLGARGSVIFAYVYLRDRGYGDDLAAGPFAEPAEPPPMRWRW